MALYLRCVGAVAACNCAVAAGNAADSVTLKFQSLKNNFPGDQKRFLRQGNMWKISKTRKYVRCKSMALYLRCDGAVAACNCAVAGGKAADSVTLKFQSLKNNFPGEQKKISHTRKYVQDF